MKRIPKYQTGTPNGGIFSWQQVMQNVNPDYVPHFMQPRDPNQAQLNAISQEEINRQRRDKQQREAEQRRAEQLSKSQHMWNWTGPLMNTSSTNAQNAEARFNFNADATQAAAKAGLAATMLANPVTSAAAIAGGTLGSKAVDTGMKFATGKTWAQNVHDMTGMNENLAEMTNPGMWAGGAAPFATRGSRTLLSAGDQIVKDATKDVIHYGPVAVLRNPKGWYRPYVDQVRNGWQGWKDAKTILPNQSKEIFKGFRSGEPIEEVERFDWKGHPMSTYTTSDPQHHDIISRDGLNFYYRTDSEGIPIWGVTQNGNEPNTFMFHIAGNKQFKLGRADKLDIHKAAEALPKGSYISDLPEENLVTGQIGMNFARQNGRTPTLGEMIKASKMKSEVVEPTPMRVYNNVHETPLSSSSMSELLSRGTNPKRPWELRYANGYMTHFNSQGLHPQLHPDNFLFVPKQERLQLTTDFVNKFHGARKPFIGLDGKLKISIPLNRKTN